MPTTALWGSTRRSGGPLPPHWPELGVPWRMYPVDNPGDWLPNGLDMADVNGDGGPDSLVNYEWTGRVRVVFHPGRGLTPDRPWPAVDVGRFPNAENAAFGDLDADGSGHCRRAGDRAPRRPLRGADSVGAIPA
jgi:hypothetical protein